LTEPHPTKGTDSELLVSHRWSNRHQHFKIMLEVFMLKKTLFAVRFILNVEKVNGKVTVVPA
jgi:hypothetical protein